MTFSTAAQSIRMASEATYKTPGTFKSILVKDPTTVITRSKIDSGRQSAGFAQGHKRSPGERAFAHSGMVNIRPVTVADASTRSAYHHVLEMIGLSPIPVYAAGPPKLLTYSRLTHEHGSVSVQDHIRQYDHATNSDRYVMTGVRGSGKFQLENGELVLAYEAMGADGAITNDPYTTAAYLDSAGKLMLGHTIHKISINALADEDAGNGVSALLRGFSIDLNMNPTIIPVMGNDGKPYAVELRPGTVSGVLVITRPTLAVANIHNILDNGKGFVIDIDFLAHENATDTTGLKISCDLGEDPRSFDGETAVMEIPFMGIYATDGTEPGRTPADNIFQLTHKTTA